MAAALLGIAALVLLLWGLNAFTKTDPRVAARVLKTSAGTAALAGAVILVALGRVGIALPLGIAGLVLLGLWPGGMGFGRRRARKSPGQISRVRSAFLEMELDHDTGAMRGRILAGHHEGVDLDSLDLGTLLGLLAEIDEESRELLATYLDRLEPGASAEEIGRAHRTLMKKLHPDQGGSTYLAARINEAKDTLLRRHR